MRHAVSRSRGFTLVELMVTISILAILMMLATPSFVSFLRSSELTSTTNTLMAAMNAARGEAMKRGAFAMVVPQDGANWHSGWIVFVDKDLSQSFDVTKDEVVLSQPALPDYLTISGNGNAGASPPYVLYNGSGYSRDTSGAFGALAFTLSRNDVPSNQVIAMTRRLIVANTGRARTCRPTSASDATCAATSTQ